MLKWYRKQQEECSKVGHKLTIWKLIKVFYRILITYERQGEWHMYYYKPSVKRIPKNIKIILQHLKFN